MALFLIVFCVIVALGFCIASAVSDYKGMTIPNAYPLAIIIAFFVAFAIHSFLVVDGDYFYALMSHLISAGVIFAITFVLFSLNALGAGDSKLATAIGFWIGIKGLMPFLFFMGICGGILGVLALFIRKKKFFKSTAEGSWIYRVQNGEGVVPYGIAIATGAIAAFWDAGYFEVTNLKILAGG